MYNPVDGPATNTNITVTSTAQILKVGASNLDERKVIILQPVDGEVYYGFSDTITSANSFKVFRGQVVFIEAGSSLDVWVVSESGDSVDTRIGELA